MPLKNPINLSVRFADEVNFGDTGGTPSPHGAPKKPAPSALKPTSYKPETSSKDGDDSSASATDLVVLFVWGLLVASELNQAGFSKSLAQAPLLNFPYCSYTMR